MQKQSWLEYNLDYIIIYALGFVTGVIIHLWAQTYTFSKCIDKQTKQIQTTQEALNNE